MLKRTRWVADFDNTLALFAKTRPWPHLPGSRKSSLVTDQSPGLPDAGLADVPDQPTAPAAQEASTAGTESLAPAPLRVRIVTLLGVILPFLGVGAAIGLLWGWGFSWVHLGLLLGMYLGTAVGVTVGYHRLFTHRSFETKFAT